MAKRPRKKKIPELRKIWDFPQEEVEALAAHLRANYPTSHHLITYERELLRRANNEPIPEIPNE